MDLSKFISQLLRILIVTLCYSLVSGCLLLSIGTSNLLNHAPLNAKNRRPLQQISTSKAYLRPDLYYTVLVCFYAAVHNNEERRASWSPSINPTQQIPKSRSTGTCMCTFLRHFTSQFLPPSQKVPVPTIGLKFFVVSDSMAMRRKPWPP
jgi:hypothetical protein